MEEQRIEDGKDGGVSSDAERESNYGDGRQPGDFASARNGGSPARALSSKISGLSLGKLSISLLVCQPHLCTPDADSDPATLEVS